MKYVPVRLDFSQIIEIVVAAAKRYLGVPDLTSEELQGVLSGGVLSGCWT